MSAKSNKAPMPGAGILCVIVGALCLLVGGLMLISGLVDSANPHVNSAGEVPGGLALLLSSILWFAIAQGLSLLARIARNTSQTAAPSIDPAQQPIADATRPKA